MLKKYGLLGFFGIAFSYLFTKFFYSKARLIRLPFDVRNKHLITLGDGLTTGKGCRLEAYPGIHSAGKILLSFGRNVEINDSVHITAMESVTIGNNVLIASKVYISDVSHGVYGGEGVHSSPDSTPNERLLITKPVIVEDNVWIGEFVSVLPGVTIGKGSIIGTMSVVTKSIPPNSIAVGSPAKVIKSYNFASGKWERVD
jgi:acetyltransferase-like isoleucine patch superfamily enzyme